MTSKTINILLADDDKDDCMLFKEALDELELSTQLTTMYNGGELMQYLAANINQLPDVLFLDLSMPRKNGFTCLKEIKRNDNFKSLPIIIFSTSYDEVMAEQLYKNGALHFICKPAEFSQLKKVIQQAINSAGKYSNSHIRPSEPPEEIFLIVV